VQVASDSHLALVGMGSSADGWKARAYRAKGQRAEAAWLCTQAVVRVGLC